MSKFFSLLLLSCSVVSFSYDNIANFRNGDRLPTSTNHSSRNQDAKVDSHVFRESIPQLSSRSDLAKQGRIHHTYIHEVVFVVKQKNIDKLTLILHDVSDPRSVNYGQHMTREEIDTLTAIPEARAALLQYLQSNGATVTSETLSGDYITAVAAISTWEKVLNTEFYTFHRTLEDGRIDKVVRAERYWIPKELDEHVESVFNTVQMPLWSNDRIPQVEVLEEDGGINKLGYDQYPGYTTLSKIRQVYNVGNSKGSAASTQGIFASISQYFSPSDLASFQSDSGLSNQPVKSVPYGYSSDSQCVSDPNNCVEGNLDVQYIMGVSEGSPTTYWYSDQSFSGWLVSVANTLNPPLVISVSYGAYEVVMSSSEMKAFNTQAIKLSTMGVTLVVASGDDGAVVRGMNSFGIGYCAYYPVFPASCPYVTTVGATAVSGGMLCLMIFTVLLLLLPPLLLLLLFSR
jgi:tripeptidyl-peptidase I